MKKTAVNPAVAGAAAPATPPVVHTSAQHPRDEYTGLGGVYVRDPATGQRTRVKPPEPPATPTDVPDTTTTEAPAAVTQ